MLGLSPDSIWLIPSTVFLAGLIGSPHCASMCGPLVINFADSKKSLLAYQGGRLLSYMTAGALIGTFGENLLGSSKPEWLTGFTLILMAALLLLNGFRTFFNRSLHFSFFKNTRVERWTSSFFYLIWHKLRKLPISKASFAASAGVMTIFLPCGHLYSFLIGTVATGSAQKGAIYMGAFWLGSAPLLSLGAGWLRPQFSGRHRWAGGLLMLAGLFSVIAFGLRSPSFAALTHRHDLQQQMKSESQHEIRCN